MIFLCCSHNNNQASPTFFFKTLLSIMLLLSMIQTEAAEQFVVSNNTGNCGKSIELDGINDWVNIPDLSLTNDFTIEGWFNLAPGIDYRDALFGQEGSGPDIHFSAGRVRLYAYGIRITAKTPLIANTWGHIALTRSGTNLTVYVNGAKDATGRWKGKLSIKAIGRGNRGYVKGKMDEIRIWDIARTEAEIGNNYDTTVTPDSAGLIGYWGFNESDQIVSDISSSANHGSLGGNTAVYSDDPVRQNSTAPLIENCGVPEVPPVANDDPVDSIIIGEAVSVSVTDNDEDTDNNLDLSSVEIVSTPNTGDATVNAAGTITYQHTGDTATTDTLTYTVKNTAGLISNEATVTFTITTANPINVAPTANDDTAVLVEVGKTISFSVTDNDEDIDGNLDSSSVEILSTPSAGNAAVNADGNITYQHTGNTAITDTLTYIVKDTEGLASNAATVTITVTEEDIIINAPPISIDDAVGPVEAGATIDFIVTNNDTDADGNISLTNVVIGTAPTNGIATVNPSGMITYSSNTGTMVAEDTLTYTVADTAGLTSNEATVTITITQPEPDNLPPVVVEDMAIVQTGEAVSIDVLANDSDSDGTLDISSLLIVSEPSSGAVDIDLITGGITYTHDGSTSTNDSFTYTVEDDLGAVSSEATVTVSITQDPIVSCGKSIEFDGVNDWINIPNLSLNDFTIEGWFKLAPGIDYRDPLFGQEGSGPDIHFSAGRIRLYAYGIRVTASTPLIADTWGHIAITRLGSNLTVYVNGEKDATGRWNGEFSIKAIGRGNRGFVKGMMDEIRIWSVARTEAEIGSSYDTTVAPNSAGLIGYWGFNEEDQIVTDASSSGNHGALGVSTAVGSDDPVRLDLTAPLNENCDNPDPDSEIPPIANDDTVNPIEIGETISFSVTNNDKVTDNTLDLSSVEIVSTPSAGDAIVNADGTITYQHTGNTAITDILTYTVKDTEGHISNEAIVTITVTEDIIINSPPVAIDDAVGSVEAGATINFTVTDNDKDADNNISPVSIVIVTAPIDGVATVNPSGTITYSSNTGTTGTKDTLTYTVADTEGLVSNEATVTITITQTVPDNLPPVVLEDTATVQSGESIVIQILENDSDDGTLDINSLKVVNDPISGTVDIDFITGKMTYTHDGSEVTSDSFTYTVADEQGAESEEATVSITITHLTASCGKGIELDGINDWVNIPDLTLANDFTIESWVKLAPGIDNKDALFGQEGSGSDINFYQGKVHLYANEDKITANTALLPNTWGHVAITRLEGSLTLYINGVEDATGTWDETLSLKAIGRGNRGYFKGEIDEVRVWNKARTEAEISASYSTDVDPDSLGLIGYWTLNERDQIVVDASSSANHGSLGINTTAEIDDPLRLDSTAPLTERCEDGNTGGNLNVPPVANNDTVGPVEAEATINFKVTDNDVDNENNLDPTSVTIVLAPTYGIATVDASGMITYTNTGTSAQTDTLHYTVADTEGAISNLGTVLILITGSSPDSRPIINIQSIIVDEFYNGNVLGSWVVQQPATSNFSYLITPEQITMTGGADNQHLTRLNTNIDPNRAYAMYSKFKINSGEGIQSYAMNFLQGNQLVNDPINSWTLNLDLAGGGIVKHMGFLNGSFRSIGSHAAPWAQANTEYIYQIDVHRRKDGNYSPKWVTGKISNLQGIVLDHFEINYSNFPWQPDLNETAGIGLNSHGADWEASDLIVWYTDDLVENSIPVANAGEDQTVTDTNDDGSEMVSLNGSLSSDLDGDNLTFSWTENSIILGSDQNIDHSFAVGEHIIILTVDDGNGGVTNDEVTITVNAGEPNVFDNIVIPPTLDNPTKIVLSNNSATINIAQYGDCGVGKVYSLNLADDEDALITFDGNGSLPYPVHIHGGKNVIIRGLDIALETQPGNEVGTVTLSSQEYNQTNPHPVVPACSALRLNVKQHAAHWVEGLYLDTKGHDTDGIIINADENSINSKVVIQNTLIKGIEGNYSYHGNVLQTQSGHLADIIFENVTMRQADEGVVLSFPVDNVEMRNVDYGTDTRFDSDDEWDDLVLGGFFAGTEVSTYSLDNVYIKYKNQANDLGFIIGGKHFTSPETSGVVVDGITTESHPNVHFNSLPPQGDYVLESQVGKNYSSF